MQAVNDFPHTPDACFVEVLCGRHSSKAAFDVLFQVGFLCQRAGFFSGKVSYFLTPELSTRAHSPALLSLACIAFLSDSMKLNGSAGGQRHWHFPKFPPPSPKPLRSRPLPAARARPSTWNQKKTLFHVSRHQRAGAASTSRATRATFRGVGRTCKRLRKKMLFLRLGIRCWMGARTGHCPEQAWAPR
jgi:hypothetical protein